MPITTNTKKHLLKTRMKNATTAYDEGISTTIPTYKDTLSIKRAD